MSINSSLAALDQYTWLILIVLGLVLGYVVLRFLWKHILKFLLQGCLFILAIAALLALLHYFKVF